MRIERKKVISLIKRSLAEDIGRGDITSRFCLSENMKLKAEIVFEKKGIVCGLDLAGWIFKLVNEKIRFKPLFADGTKLRAGRIAARLDGPGRSILTAERTALNFLGHLSGIATQTSRFAEKVTAYKARIMDTRKTLPGLRYLEKYAVRTGGGYNHRMGLYDQVLIKDNHLLAAGYGPQAANLRDLIKRAKKKRPKGLKVEIEVENLKEFKQALTAGPDIIMLDNMPLKDIKKAVILRKRLPKLEVSGNVSLENVRQIAATGVDMISIGSLTHSAKSIDLSLKIYR
ncbi:MAG: carboxylating nicotinate-nucleotide diphosphorylase [Candidatus Omnitrophota bacterium]|nr:carboxylating nicotinate-nucleotide diphosphorylase [Candidatus Omnitrophota bacterium]